VLDVLIARFFAISGIADGNAFAYRQTTEETFALFANFAGKDL